MAGSAELVQFRWGQPLGIENRPGRSRALYVILPWAVAGLTVHACFRHLDLMGPAELERASGMASKASERGGRRFESAVAAPFRIGVAWRNPHCFPCRVVAKPMLDVCIAIQLTDVGDGFRPGAECPLSDRILRRRSQGVCVPRLRLTRAFLRMAACAHLMADVLRAEAGREEDEYCSGGYK